MAFAELVERVLRSQAVRKFYARVPDDHVLDDSYTPVAFGSDEAYFVLTLSEMYLRDRREYWRGFIPVCLVITDFMYDDKREVTPFFVGNQLLSTIEALVKDQEVEYRNTTVAGPLPYVGGNVGLFVGLFRAAVSDSARALFSFIEQISDAFSLSGFSAYRNVARVLTKGLPELLGMKDMEFRFGMRDEFGSPKRGGAVFRHGYLACVNCPEQSLNMRDLWVQDGRLRIQGGSGGHRPYVDSDFCLMQVNRLTERDDYQKLPFYSLWKNIHRSIWEGQAEKARRELWPQFARAVALSPDLVRSDKFHLQGVFKVHFEREVDKYFEMTRPGPGPVHRATRGDEPLDARARVVRTAEVGSKISKDVETSLLDIIEKWDHIPPLEAGTGPAVLGEKKLEEQLRTLKEITGVRKPDPGALAETLVADAIRFQSQ